MYTLLIFLALGGNYPGLISANSTGDDFKMNFLKSVPLLKNQSTELLNKLKDNVKVRTYRAGGEILQQGSKGEDFFFVVQGSVRVNQTTPGGSKVLATLKRGDYFGEQALLNQDCITASVTAIDPGNEVLSLSKQHFDSLLEHLPELTKKTYKDLVGVSKKHFCHKQ